MGILGSLLTGAAQALTNKAAEGGAQPSGKKAKTDCSPCAARAKQAQIQAQLGVKKGWYKR